MFTFFIFDSLGHVQCAVCGTADALVRTPARPDTNADIVASTTKSVVKFPHSLVRRQRIVSRRLAPTQRQPSHNDVVLEASSSRRDD